MSWPLELILASIACHRMWWQWFCSSSHSLTLTLKSNLCLSQISSITLNLPFFSRPNLIAMNFLHELSTIFSLKSDPSRPLTRIRKRSTPCQHRLWLGRGLGENRDQKEWFRERQHGHRFSSMWVCLEWCGACLGSKAWRLFGYGPYWTPRALRLYRLRFSYACLRWECCGACLGSKAWRFCPTTCLAVDPVGLQVLYDFIYRPQFSWARLGWESVGIKEQKMKKEERKGLPYWVLVWISSPISHYQPPFLHQKIPPKTTSCVRLGSLA